MSWSQTQITLLAPTLLVIQLVIHPVLERMGHMAENLVIFSHLVIFNLSQYLFKKNVILTKQPLSIDSFVEN